MENEDIIIEETKNSKLKKFLKVFLFLFLFLFVSFYLYIRYIEPKFIKVEEKAIVDSTLPDVFNGFKIVQFSDIHYGSSINEGELKTIVKKINELKPDVIVFTGDLFNETIHLNNESFEQMKNSLKDLSATLKKYAVVGNSDVANKEKYLEIMNEVGFTILENTNDLVYYKGNNPIEFIGTSSVLEQEIDIDKALQSDEDDTEYFKIWLNHEPIVFDLLVDKDIHPNILLTGHTLGGLIHIPFYGYLLKQDGIDKYTTDYYHKKRISMYISNGLGTYKYDVRFLNRPSISFYRLYNH